MTLELATNPQLIDFLMVADNLCADERDQYESATGGRYDPQQMALSHITLPGPKWVLFDEGKPIAIAGYLMQRPGVWRDWMLTTPECWMPENWFSVTRHVRRVMDMMLKDHAHRLECVSKAGRERAHKWYRCLGLVSEGTLSGWGADGCDAVLFARVRKHPHGR